MEEQNNVVNTTATVEKEGSKFGWGVLGFFIPLVGLILFLVWMKTKPKSSKASGLGALIGFLVGLFLTIISIVVFFTILGGEIGRLFGNYNNEDYKPITITDIDDEEEVEDECSLKYEKGSNKYEYVIDVEKDYKNNKGCEFLTYKLNDDFTVKYKVNEASNFYSLYVNDKEITGGLLHIKSNIYVNGKTLVTREESTDLGAAVYLVNPSGIIYSVSSSTDLINIDNMTKKDYKIDDDGNLVISGTRHSNIYGEEIAGQYVGQENMCNTSFEDLISQYGVSENYDFKSDFIFKMGQDGYYSLLYSDKKVTQTWHEFYNNICNR